MYQPVSGTTSIFRKKKINSVYPRWNARRAYELRLFHNLCALVESTHRHFSIKTFLNIAQLIIEIHSRKVLVLRSRIRRYILGESPVRRMRSHDSQADGGRFRFVDLPDGSWRDHPSWCYQRRENSNGQASEPGRQS